MMKSAQTRDLCWNSTKRKMKILFYTSLFLSLLISADAAHNCTQIVGSYRDCTCGIKYRDVERQCQDELTDYQPILSQQNLSCPFQCLNGGELFENKHCSCPQSAHGLCCEVPTPHCGQIFLEPTGEIKSPGFDLNIPYLPNSDCTWKISTDVNRTIALGLVDNTFDVEEGASMFVCNHDYLTVYDADNEDQDKSRGRFCGDAFGMRAFRTLYSSGRHLYLTFKSNDKNQRKGFHLQYRTFLKGTRCGRTSFNLPTGLITSPQYPINYQPQEACEYEIQVKPGHELLLKTLELNVPSVDPQCLDWREDRIQVLKKKVGSKLYKEVTSFCGKNLYPLLPIRGASSVLLKFKSNTAREGRFLLQYEQVPV